MAFEKLIGYRQTILKPASTTRGSAVIILQFLDRSEPRRVDREIDMKRGLIVFSLCAVVIVAYFISSKWAIHHKTLTFEDPLRGNRPVMIDVVVRRDREMEAIADMIELPVAIVSHGNTVKNTEYSFLT